MGGSRDIIGAATHVRRQQSLRGLACVALAAMIAGSPPLADKVTAAPASPPSMSHGNHDFVSITKQQDLRFGQVVMIGNGGSIMLPADGLPVYSGVVPMAGTPTLARFEISGPANKAIQLQLTFPVSGSYGSGGSAKLDTLSVRADYTTAFRQDGTLVQVKLDASGQNAITVGGKLTLSSPVPGKTSIIIPISATLVTGQ